MTASTPPSRAPSDLDASSLDPAAVARFRRDGHLFPIPVLAPSEAATLADELLDLAERGIDGHPVPWNQKTYLLLPSLDALLRDPRITGPVAAILGEELLALSADVFVKPAASTRRITWHQDVNFWHLDPYDMLTAWVALTPATPDNGGMHYASGRHRGRLEHLERPDPENMLSRGQELAVEVADAEAVDVVLAPGEMSFHHALTPHASGPNRTDAPRIGFAIRYASAVVRQLAGLPISARLARGNGRCVHFDLEPGPDAPLSPSARAAHRRALEAHAATNYSTV